MSVYKINGVWRSDSANAPEPNEKLDETVTASSNITTDANFDTSSWTETATATTTAVNYSYFYWRWDGIRWVYEPDWIWSGYVYQYPGCWTTTSTSGFRVLQWNGKTIIYRLTNAQIEFAVVSPKGEINFIYTDSLETVLKALK